MRENLLVTKAIKITRERRGDGTVIRVFTTGGAQAIKLDCLERNAHYHLDPDGRNIVRSIEDADPLEWAARALRSSLSPMLRAAGYEEAAADVGREQVRSQIEEVAATLQHC